MAYNVFNVGDTNENYTKKMLVDEIKKVIPDSKIKYVKKNEDPRDYRVNCDKIKKELGFKISMTVPDGILEIKRLIQENLIKDPENQKYYNIPHESPYGEKYTDVIKFIRSIYKTKKFIPLRT